jgi:diguanylate cyclase (GGDEF)-like protein
MSIIANESRSATLIAMTDIELLVLHGIDFYRIIFEHPMIGIKMLKTIGKVQNTWLDQTSRHLHDIMRWGETARQRAVSDELTGLYNRRFLEESANERFTQGSMKLRGVSLMMMDLDKIHEINSNFGTKAGDLVIITAAEVLRSATRAGDICARLSGDEFAILLPDTKQEEARLIGEKVCKTMISQKILVPSSPNGVGQTEISVSTSIGIASAPVHADTWQSLSSIADRTLRRAKELGRNQVVVAE